MLKIKRVIFILFLFMQVVSCKMDESEIKTGWWKHQDGFHLTDALILNNANFKNDTIFYKGNPAAILSARIKLDRVDKIKIRSIASGEVGWYVHKSL